jgi:hypothetical protein
VKAAFSKAAHKEEAGLAKARPAAIPGGKETDRASEAHPGHCIFSLHSGAVLPLSRQGGYLREERGIILRQSQGACAQLRKEGERADMLKKGGAEQGAMEKKLPGAIIVLKYSKRAPPRHAAAGCCFALFAHWLMQ